MLKTNNLKSDIMALDSISLQSKYNGDMHMEENRETGKKKTMDISVLSHEITYRRYLLNKGKVKDF